MEEPEARSRQCEHLTRGQYPLHSTVAWDTVPENNPTDYAWHERIALCTYCSGKLRGVVSAHLRLDLRRQPDEEQSP